MAARLLQQEARARCKRDQIQIQSAWVIVAMAVMHLQGATSTRSNRGQTQIRQGFAPYLELGWLEDHVAAKWQHLKKIAGDENMAVPPWRRDDRVSAFSPSAHQPISPSAHPDTWPAGGPGRQVLDGGMAEDDD